MSARVPASHVRLKRVYEPAAEDDGARVLVDRLWPRGLRKDEAAIERWAKAVAPTTELRRWFGHDPARWDDFRARYTEELRAHGAELDELRALARHGRLTLLYSAHDEAHNQAIVLREVLLG